MEKAFYQSILKTCIYQRKEGTKASFYYQSGDKFLPNRISITQSEVCSVQKKGRNLLRPFQGQMLGTFSRTDESPYKQNPPFNIRTQIWGLESVPVLLFGTIGISDEAGKTTKDDGDLIAFLPDGYQWNRMKIYLLPACGKNPADIEAAMIFLMTLGLTF